MTENSVPQSIRITLYSTTPKILLKTKLHIIFQRSANIGNFGLSMGIKPQGVLTEACLLCTRNEKRFKNLTKTNYQILTLIVTNSQQLQE